MLLIWYICLVTEAGADMHEYLPQLSVFPLAMFWLSSFLLVFSGIIMN